MTTRRTVFMTAVVLVSALAGGVAFSGSAVALDADTAAPYPHSPGTTVDEFPVSVVAQRSDAITRNGMKSITLNFGADSSFDGSVQNVSAESVSVFITGQNNTRTLGSFNVSTNQNGQVTVTFRQPVSVRAGDRIVVDVGNVTTPSSDGDYVVGVSATTPSGRTDGPVTVGYRVAGAELTFPNQSASQFSGNQTVTVSGIIPNAGYVGVFKMAENGSRGELVGSTQPILARYDTRNYTVNLSGNVKQSQRLVAVAYYETSGGSQSERLNATFDPSEDNVVTNNGVPVNATGYVTTVNATARVTAGTEYDQGARLYFSQGQPNTGYRIQLLQNGTPSQTATTFETGANGTEVITTADLNQGQYIITRVDNGSVVGLDNDSTTSQQDDSFFVTGQTVTQTTSTVNDTATGGNTTAAGAGGSNDTAAGGGGNGGGAGNGGSGGNGSGGSGNGGGSGGSGPGFGVIVALVAVLAAGLLAVRRER
jgi:PGF-CTERM protein